MVHFLLYDHVNEMTNGGSFTERVGTVMNCMNRYRSVGEQLEHVGTREILFSWGPSLAERKPHQTEVDIGVLLRTSWLTISATLSSGPSSMESRWSSGLWPRVVGKSGHFFTKCNLHR